MKKRRFDNQEKNKYPLPPYINQGYEVSLPESFANKQLISIKDIHTLYLSKKKAGTSWAPECHTAWEIAYVIEGEVTHIVETHTYNLRAGDIIFIPPMAFHELCPLPDKSCEILNMSFDLEGTFANRLKNVVYHIGEPEKLLLDAVLNYISYYNNKYQVPYSGEPHYSIGVPSYLTFYHNMDALQVIIRLFEAFFLSVALAEHTNAREADENDDMVIRVIQLLEENAHSQINVAEIAALFGISGKTLQARFKESTGYTLHKFFLNIKIRSAVDLLKKGHTVSEVSDMLGFCNSNYFSQVFRRETGKNPGSFK